MIEPVVVPDLVDESLAGLGIAHGRDHVEAGAGEVDGDAASDAAARTGDDGDSCRFHRRSLEAAHAKRKSVQTSSVKHPADDDVADDAVGLELVDVGVAQTEDAGQHVAVVLTEERRAGRGGACAGRSLNRNGAPM